MVWNGPEGDRTPPILVPAGVRRYFAITSDLPSLRPASTCVEGLEEDYMVPQLPYYDQYINVGEAQGGTINCETQSTVKKPRHNQDHPSALVPFVPTDDNVANMGSINNIAKTKVLETLIQAAFNDPMIESHMLGVEVERMKTTKFFTETWTRT
ncbi:hypothetical protein Sjap_017499 [Stephania japonica]|uniref:Uncharacterized protein n=1 Tax=Stephania japonica TaxID=461633 RepID=A0AAP0I698_9MAGN